jgi:prolyl oligopeptidase PreP (S9A serine peptidase family)
VVVTADPLVGANHDTTTDLMKVALPAVGVMDMLRYHTFTSGAGWATIMELQKIRQKCLLFILKNYSQ